MFRLARTLYLHGPKAIEGTSQEKQYQRSAGDVICESLLALLSVIFDGQTTAPYTSIKIYIGRQWQDARGDAIAERLCSESEQTDLDLTLVQVISHQRGEIAAVCNRTVAHRRILHVV